MRKETIALALALALSAASCGGDPPEDPGGPGASSSGGKGGSGGEAGGGGEGGGAALSCEAVDEPSLGEVTIAVTNGRSTGVFYRDDKGDFERHDAPYEVTFESLPEAESHPLLEGCGSPPLDWNPGALFEIPPGKTATFTWSGLLWERRKLPGECEHEYCADAVAPDAGEVGAVTAKLFESCDPDTETCSGPLDVTVPLTYGDTEVKIAVEP